MTSRALIFDFFFFFIFNFFSYRFGVWYFRVDTPHGVHLDTTMSDGVQQALQALQRSVEADTEVMIGEMEVMERANINSSGKYARLVDNAQDLVTMSSAIKSTANDIKERLVQLDEIISEVDRLELLAVEIDEWSRELEIKLRRLNQNHGH